MNAPFDTLKLARRFEAAGFDPKQAGDMAEAIAEATASAELATKADLVPLATTKVDLADAKVGLVKWMVSIAVAQVATVLAVLKLFPAT